MIDFRISEDQSQIVAAVVATLNRAPITADPAPWTSNDISQTDVAKLGSLGWIGIAAPENCGGSAASVTEEALIAREYGRWLVSPDLIATAVAAGLAAQAGDLTGARNFVEGSQAAAFGVLNGSDADEDPDSYTVVQAGATSHYLVFRVRGPALVRANRSLGFKAGVDPAMRSAVLDSADLNVVHAPEAGAAALLNRTLILLAAMLAGNAEASRDLAVEYAKTRKQFGRLIGSFQAIKHHCADMHVRARLAYAQALHAAMLDSAGSIETAAQASAAFAVAAAAAVKNAEVGIQIHGAMGFSAECVAHRFLKRAHVLRIIGDGASATQPVISSLLESRQ